MSAARRRAPADGPRRLQLVVRFSVGELADLGRVAEREGLAVGAWIGRVAVQAARTDDPDVHRRLLRDVVAVSVTCSDPVLLGRLGALADALVERLP